MSDKEKGRSILDLSSIEIGMRFKNYKEFCKALDVPILGGNSKKAQLSNIERIIEYERDGIAYVIKDIDYSGDLDITAQWGGDRSGGFPESFRVNSSEMDKSGVYRIIDYKTNEVYVGSTTTTFRNRYGQHYSTGGHLGISSQLEKNELSFEVIESYDSIERSELLQRELGVLLKYAENDDFIVINKKSPTGSREGLRTSRLHNSLSTTHKVEYDLGVIVKTVRFKNTIVDRQEISIISEEGIETLNFLGYKSPEEEQMKYEVYNTLDKYQKGEGK